MPFDATAFHLIHPLLEVVGSDRFLTCASVELLLDGLVALGQFGMVHILWKHVFGVARKVVGVEVVDNVDLGLCAGLLDLVVLLLQLQNGSWCETAGICKTVGLFVVSVVLCTRGSWQNAIAV